MANVTVTVHIKTPLVLKIAFRFCWLMLVLGIWAEGPAKYAAASFYVALVRYRVGSRKWRRLRGAA